MLRRKLWLQGTHVPGMRGWVSDRTEGEIRSFLRMFQLPSLARPLRIYAQHQAASVELAMILAGAFAGSWQNLPGFVACHNAFAISSIR